MDSVRACLRSTHGEHLLDQRVGGRRVQALELIAVRREAEGLRAHQHFDETLHHELECVRRLKEQMMCVVGRTVQSCVHEYTCGK